MSTAGPTKLVDIGVATTETINAVTFGVGITTTSPISWLPWNPWSDCSKPQCDYGYQERMRTCELCNGQNDVERKLCNTMNCEGEIIY